MIKIENKTNEIIYKIKNKLLDMDNNIHELLSTSIDKDYLINFLKKRITLLNEMKNKYPTINSIQKSRISITIIDAKVNVINEIINEINSNNF